MFFLSDVFKLVYTFHNDFYKCKNKCKLTDEFIKEYENLLNKKEK
jgi:hypothetical protein